MSTEHKGTEFNNIIETWEQNERDRESGKIAGKDDVAAKEPASSSDLEQVIKQEATEYDNENKENQLLSGDRATVNDDFIGKDDSGA
ncbi:MAG: hypothetical protein JWR18_993 [Segetibacter sp.]|jgi:hypothetical protein|nr:hypothetical protein [Segetibacter sp.]